jgi:hypothetical protein
MLTLEQKIQFSEILEELGKTLDITEDQYEAAVKSYKYVGEWLSQNDSPLATYSPEILPQGSFLLQTMIRPINEEDELDIDLVCKLEKVQASWTQFALKKLVGDRLKANGILNKLLKLPDGKRCWTLQYAESAKFHLDVLPSVVATGYRTILEKAFSATELSDTNILGIRITDKNDPKYTTSTNLQEWLKSNPFGYAIWFKDRCRILTDEIRMLSEAIQPVPKYQKDKLPLQRVVQILKWHRDMMFNGDEHKPISIIITTLASRAYNKETDIIDALVNVVSKMRNHISDVNPYTGAKEKWVSNPVHLEENFADRWKQFPIKQTNFYKWLDAVELDVKNIVAQQGRGLQFISELMVKPFGREAITKTFSNYGANQLKKRESGALKMAAGTGMIASSGRAPVTQHTPFGADE